MVSIKLSVTIELQGGTMMTSQECDKNPQENYKRNFMLLDVKHYDKKTRKSFFRREPLIFNTRKCVPAHQCINICEEAYEHMISQSCPEWYFMGINKWKKLSPEERLELHMENLCKALNGKSYTYVVFGD